MSLAAPLLLVPVGCDECPPDAPTEGRLFVEVRARRLCAVHWRKYGCPWPTEEEASSSQTHANELRTRERMLARGGAFRHLVRSGKT